MDSNEQVAPEEPTCGMCHQRIYLAGDEWKHRIDDSIWCPRMTARPAALAKQGSPPNARLCKGCQTPLDESGAQSVDGWIYHKRCAPPAAKWDKSGLKESCQRALKLGRTRQEMDIQLVLDMLLEIERLEAARTSEKSK